MRKKKTNTLSRLACLLLTVSLLWLLPACGSDSASPFPPEEETVRAAAESWTGRCCRRKRRSGQRIRSSIP